ncbi:hypothetical protein [Arachidicoccus sp.]|uniref:hypothetical protein n=1 Tax=Arachidicoccus sp. TaxID=1872624 RepID=UPI003D1DF507
MDNLKEVNLPVMNDLKIKFDGDSSIIEANTLINNLLHFSSIVQEVNKELNTGRKIDIKIQAIEEGSFIVNLLIESNVLQNIKNLLSNDTVQYAANLLGCVTGVYAIAKFLKGKKGNQKEQTGNNVEIENNNGTVQIFNIISANVYTNNKNVREALSQEFKTLDNDKNITGLEFLNKDDEQIVVIPSEDFADIASLDEIDEPTEYRSINKEGILNVYTITFGENVKWGFYYEGNKISAKITDIKFTELIDKGERFAKGDTLRADIEIYQKFEPSINAYINKSYKVTKILEHIPRPEQGNLFNQK